MSIVSTKKHRISWALFKCLSICCAILFVTTANATDYTWTGTADSVTWSNAGNWDSGDGTPGDDGYPDGADDTATISTSSNAISATGALTLGALTLSGDYAGTLSLSSTLTIDDSSGKNGNLDVSAGTLQTAKDALGSITVDQQFNVGASGTIIVRRSSTTSGGAGQIITASTMNIDGTIDATGQGYAKMAGPGHGSLKGSYGGQAESVATYGSFTNPTSLGSGGDSQPGGGAIVLVASGAISIAGTVSANTTTACSYYCGSGGSINITASELSGAGIIQADGGADSGGGRISFDGVTNFAFTGTVEANGVGGADGTIYLNSQMRSNLEIGGTGNIQTLRLGYDGTNDYTFGEITIHDGGTLEVSGNWYAATGGKGVTLNVTNLTIESGGKLSAEGLGFARNGGPGTSSTASSHGGQNNTKATYGDFQNPTTLGSGADRSNGNGGGGGAIIVVASGNIVVNGAMTADTKTCDFYCGSGGSVNLTAAQLSGSGSISASGEGSGGSGGRISFAGISDFVFTGTVKAYGNQTGTSSGTIYLNSQLRSNLELGGTGHMQSLRLGSDGTHDYELGAITIHSGGTLEVSGNQFASTDGVIPKISATSVAVESGGTLSANGLGFGSCKGPGYGADSTWGAAYGGATEKGVPYGSITNPLSLGSGGSWAAGAGGLVFDVSGDVVIDGSVSANGATIASHGGSGGTVNFVADNISGSGSVNATGANSAAGGRVAFKTRVGTSFGSITFLALGNGVGAPGTVYLETPSDGAGNGTLIIDTSTTTPTYKTVINSAVTDRVVGRLQLKNKAQLTIASDSDLTLQGTGVTLSIASGTTLQVDGSLGLGGTGISNNGSLVVTNPGSTIRYLGQANDAAVSMISGLSYYNLEVNNAGTTFTAPAALSIAGNLTVTAGILDLNNYDITLGGTASKGTQGSITHYKYNPTAIASLSAESTPSLAMPTVSWGASTDQGPLGMDDPTYTVQWSQAESFASGVSEITTNSTSYEHTSALGEGAWYFRVKGTNLGSNSTDWKIASYLVDTTAPSGGSVSYTDGIASSETVVLSVADGTDSTSGIDTSTRSIERQSAVFSNGSCGTFGSWSSISVSGSYSSFTDATAVGGGCYKYRYLVSDQAGNQATYIGDNVVKVDTGAPSTPTGLSVVSPTADQTPTWSWSASSDAHSGLSESAAYSIQLSQSSDFSSGVQSFTSSGATFAPTENLNAGTWYLRVRANDVAGNNSSYSAAVPVVIDLSSPSGGSISYSNGYRNTLTVALTANDGTDADASIDTTSRIIQRQSASLSAGACGVFGSFASISPSGTYPSFSDSTVLGGVCYKYRYLVSDTLGNQATYTNSNVVMVDTVQPTAPSALYSPTPSASNLPTWSWTASSDEQSGMAGGSYQIEWSTDSSFTQVTGTALVQSVSYTHQQTLATGRWYARVKAIDAAGNASSYSSVGVLDILGFKIRGIATLDGKPLSGTLVQGGALGNRLTGDDGIYEFDGVLYGTTFTLVPTRPGYEFTPQSITSSVVDDVEINFATTNATARLTMTGYVYDHNGAPIVGAKVLARNISGSGEFETTSDASGYYQIENMPVGQYSVEVSVDGVVVGTIVAEVNETIGERSVVIRQGALLPIGGTVVLDSISGEPINGVIIKLNGTTQVTSDSIGEFQFDSLTPGDYTITGEKEGYEFDAVSVTLTNVAISDVLLKARTKLGSPAYFFWTGTDNVTETVDVGNSGTTKVSYRVSMYDRSGKLKSKSASKSLAAKKLAAVRLNQLGGYSAASYGIGAVTYSGGTVFGRAEEATDSALMLSDLVNPIKGTSYVGYNTNRYDQQSQGLVKQTLQLANLCTAKKSFTIYTYDSSSRQLGKRKVSVVAKGRIDIDGVPSFGISSSLGYHAIVPSDSACGYLARLVKSSATEEPQRWTGTWATPSSSGGKRYLSILSSAVSPAYLESSNTTTSPFVFKVRGYSKAGKLLGTKKVTIKSKRSSALLLSSLFSTTEDGYISIEYVSGSGINQLSYYPSAEQTEEIGVSIPRVVPNGSVAAGVYNVSGNNVTRVIIENISASTVSYGLEVVLPTKTKKIQSTLKPGVRREFVVSTTAPFSAPSPSKGVVRVTSGVPGAILMFVR